MRVQFTFVGEATMHDAGKQSLHVEMPVVPREGETVDVPGLGQHLTVVRTVVWYPFGDDGDGDPFVYVVLGQPRDARYGD